MITCLFSTKSIFISFLPEKVIDVVARSCFYSFICVQFRHEVIQVKLWLERYFSMNSTFIFIMKNCKNFTFVDVSKKLMAH